MLTQNPDNPGLLATMGTMYLQSRRYGLAISFLHRSAERTPKATFSAISESPTNTRVNSRNPQVPDQSHRTQPFRRRLGELCRAVHEQRHAGQGHRTLPKAIKLDPQCAIAHWNMALAMLEWSVGQGMGGTRMGLKSKMRIDRKIADAPNGTGRRKDGCSIRRTGDGR